MHHNKERAKMTSRQIFYLFAVTHLFVWTFLLYFTQHNLPLDVIEQVAWGQEWQLGYWKHPPLSSWITAAAFNIGGEFAVYFIGQLVVIIAFYFVWLLAKDLLKEPKHALFAVLLLEPIYYYSLATAEFNANIIQYPFWAATCYLAWCSVCSVNQPKSIYLWSLTAFVAALGLYGKYSFILLPLAVFLYVITGNRTRSIMLKPAIWSGLIIAIVTLSLHFNWLISNDFISINYAFTRAGGDSLDQSGFLSSHLLQPFGFLFTQLLLLIPSIFLIFILFRKPHDIDFKGEKARFLFWVACGPILFTFLLAVITGVGLRSMWAAPMLLLLPLAIIYLYENNAIKINRLKAFYYIYIGVVLALILAQIAIFALSPLVTHRAKRTHFPGKALTVELEQALDGLGLEQEQYNIVVGDIWSAGNLATYGDFHVFIDEDIEKSPWVCDLDIRNQTGYILVWLSDKRASSISELNLQEDFPELDEDFYDRVEIQEPLMAERLGLASGEAVLNWAIIRDVGEELRGNCSDAGL